MVLRGIRKLLNMKKLILSLGIAMTMISCNTNPFFSEWDNAYGIPDFESIKNEHYLPAVKEGIARQAAEIAAITANPEAPTFENTILAMEMSGDVLGRVSAVLFNVSESNSSDTLRTIVAEVLPLLSEHSDNIYMNSDLFARVDVLVKNEEGVEYTQEQKMLLKKIYDSFVNNGIALDEAGQARMREINKQLSSLSNKFGDNLLAENNAFAEKFGVSISEYQGAMAATSDRELRKKMFEGYSQRCNHGNEYDNKEIINQIIALRIEKAKMLGYDCPANFILSNKMAKNAETVDTFLADLMQPAVAKAREEVVQMQKFMDEDVAAGLLPAGSKIEPWDWTYYTEKVRKAKYALDEEELKPYFKMENVRAGVFATASRLFGLQFEAIEDAPVYHPEVEVFKVSDEDGSLLGILLTDYFPRSSKRGGAWMSNFQDQYMDLDSNMVRPVIVNVGNFAKPTEDKPSLLTLDQTATMFHEFGHALHGLLSQCTYKTVSGTSVARDFVELPSQIMENWAFNKEVLLSYAHHYETGEVIPEELITKIQAADHFNQGFMTTELVAASILDLKWHCQTSLPEDPIAFEKEVCSQMGLIDEIIPRYRSTYFAHIFSGGYSAGYYSYLWAEVLDKDAFELFEQKGVFDKETAMSFRRNILEAGGSDEPMILYRRFRGADPDPAALLRARGL